MMKVLLMVMHNVKRIMTCNFMATVVELVDTRCSGVDIEVSSQSLISRLAAEATAVRVRISAVATP